MKLNLMMPYWMSKYYKMRKVMMKTCLTKENNNIVVPLTYINSKTKIYL